jgi:hypothetical protein
MERLHKSCRRLIWLNPLLRFDRFEPRAGGIKAMLPSPWTSFEVLPRVHNLASLEHVASGHRGFAPCPSCDTEGRRWAWMLSMLWPLMPFVGLAAHHASGIEAALALPLLISYGLMPLLDALIGKDPNNPPDAVVRQLDADRYYRWLTWATVPLHFVALIGCAWWAGTQDLSWWAFLLLAYVAGTDAGLGLNTAHELGHKNNPLEQWLARLALAVPAYGHFTVEHGRGHHRWVATPEDHASCPHGRVDLPLCMRENCPAASAAPGRWSRSACRSWGARAGAGATPCCSPTR